MLLFNTVVDISRYTHNLIERERERERENEQENTRISSCSKCTGVTRSDKTFTQSETLHAFPDRFEFDENTVGDTDAVSDER